MHSLSCLVFSTFFVELSFLRSTQFNDTHTAVFIRIINNSSIFLQEDIIRQYALFPHLPTQQHSYECLPLQCPAASPVVAFCIYLLIGKIYLRPSTAPLYQGLGLASLSGCVVRHKNLAITVIVSSCCVVVQSCRGRHCCSGLRQYLPFFIYFHGSRISLS